MDAIVSYIIKCVIASGILVAYYLIALRNRKFNGYNRFYLLATMIASLVIPFINVQWFSINTNNSSTVNTLLLLVNNGKPTATQHNSAQQAGLIATVTISCILLAILFAKVVWILNVKRRHTSTQMPGYTFIETSVKQAPFSFLDNLFWKKGMALNDANGEKIFKHELTHIKQKHTYDKLFTQVAVCIFWMNPFYWFIQRELNMIHEFIADEGCVEEGDVASFAMMLLQSHNGGRYLNPTHSFFHSPIKRRLIMITTSKNTPYSYARRVLALPVAVLVLAMFSFSVGKAQQKDSIIKSIIDKKIETDIRLKKAVNIEKIDGEIIVTKNQAKKYTIAYNPADSISVKEILQQLQNHPNASVISITTKDGKEKKYLLIAKTPDGIKTVPARQ